ncbi:type IV secretory system conjugative DNA transfer family protein [Limnohabitans sp.]|uniref:type IV secretory system conjugative DNA transfer family protein n=1 Tax=Limnohabitans sp. TaxID=1907725 RepID=UPI0037BEB11B
MLGVDARNRPIRMSAEQRAKHLYVVGGTGMGKSRLLTSLIQQDIDQWLMSRSGLMLIDLHGELYQQVMGWLTEERILYRDRPIVPIDLTQPQHVVGYNLLRPRQGPSSTSIDALVEAIAYAQGQDSAQETPRFKRLAGAALHALAANGMGITEIFDVLAPENRALRERLVQQLPRSVGEGLRWLDSLPAKEQGGAIESTLNRVSQFLNNPNIERMLGQTASSFDFLTAMEEGAIVLVNLASVGNHMSRPDARMMATLLLADVWTAASERGKSKVRGQSPKPFYLYLDEFQHFITPTIAENLDEARGFGLHLTLANQFPSQLSGEGVRGQRLLSSVRSNILSKVVMGLPDPDEYMPLAKWLFTGEVDTYKVKHEIHTRAVIGERETTRTVITTGESQTDTEGGGETESTGTSSGGAANRGIAKAHSYGEFRDDDERYSFIEQGNPEDQPARWSKTETESDGKSDTWGESEGSSSTSNWSTARGTSRSVAVTPFMEREWDTQLSSRTYQSVDEQIFEMGQRIFRLQPRQAIIRLQGDLRSCGMTTLPVPDAFVSPSTQETFRLRCLQRLGFVLPQEQAQAAIEARRNWAEKLIAPPQEEPQEFTNRRRMKPREE